MNPILRQQSPEASLDLPPTPDVPLIAEYTHPYGMNYVKVEAVSLVDRTGRHRLRSAAVAAAGDAAGRDGTSRRRESQRRARVARHVAGAGAGLSPTGHPGRRPLRRRGARPHAQRNHQPPRRLAVARAADRNGRARRTDPPRQRAWAWPKGRCLVDPSADPEVRSGHRRPAAESSAAAWHSSRVRWGW